MIKSDRNFGYTILFLLLLPAALSAQGYYFGRNKVQYTDFDWHILKTRHFDIYYYPEMKDIAEKGARFAEDSYVVLESKFNHSVNRRIPLIFYSSHLHFQQTNVTPGFVPEGVGGFFEFLKGRVVIPSNGSLNQFRKVIRHELVHVFMHSKILSSMRDRGRLNSAIYPPLWFTEGLAEHWSSSWDSQAEMVIKDAVLHNYMVSLQDIWTVQGTFMMYKIGQNILDYIAENYGDDKVLLLMENLWKHNSFEESFIETIGMSYAEFDQKWLYHLQKKYYPQLATDDFSKNTSQTIVREGYNFKPACYSENGTNYVVFMGNRTGYSSIFMRPLVPLRMGQDEDREILIKGEKSSDFEAFHLFSSKIDVNQSGILAFGSKSGENDALYLYDIPNRKILTKYYFDHLVAILSPSWSPDGKKVAFSGLSFHGYNDIYVFNTETEELTQLTNDFYDDLEPSWSPDGNFIVFSSDRTEFGKQWAYNIFLLNVNNGEISYITYGNQKDLAPTFSPDGRYIAFTSDRDLTLNVYLAEINKQNEPVRYYKVTKFANAIFDPEWTPDGGMLFAVYEDRQFQIRYLGDFLSHKNHAEVFDVPVIVKRDKPWEFENLQADEEIGRVRYEKKYDLDIVQSQVSQDPIFGTAGGAQAAFTDILGNDQYHILIYNNAQATSDILRSFNFAVTKVSLEKRTNYAVGLFRYAGRYFNYDDSYYYEERAGGFVSLSYPISQFTRLEFSSSYSYSDKDIYGSRRRFAVLAANYLSFTKDNSIWGPSGPLEGQRIKLTLGNTFDIKYSNVNYYTAIADFRQYFRLSLRSAYAVRMLYLVNKGKEAQRFYIGGSWDVRGYPLWSIRGQQIVFTSHELRFPFIDLVGIRFPFGSIGFNSIRGALFVDAVNAWDNAWGEKGGIFGSFGAGLRMRLVGYLVLRLDFGKRTNFKSVSDGIFTQFFFGWDF
jgi:Tol biopolymer transport system component